MPDAASVTVVDSSRVSSSAWAVTVTVCAVFQSVVVNVSAALSTVAAPLSALATVTVVAVAGTLSSVTVKVRALFAWLESSFSARVDDDTVASSDRCATFTLAVVSVPFRLWAASATVTASVLAVLKSVPS